MGYIVSNGDIPDLVVGLPNLELRRESFVIYTDYGEQRVELDNDNFFNLKKMVDWMATRPEFRAVLNSDVETFFCWECFEDHRRFVPKGGH